MICRKERTELFDWGLLNVSLILYCLIHESKQISLDRGILVLIKLHVYTEKNRQLCTLNSNIRFQEWPHAITCIFKDQCEL